MSKKSRNWNPARTETAVEGIVESDEVLSRLSGQRVMIVAGQVGNPNCQHALFTLVNLLSRLDPVVSEVGIAVDTDAKREIYVPKLESEKVTESIHELTDLIDSPALVEVVDGLSHKEHDAVVQIGCSKFEGDPDIKASSDGWLVQLSTDGSATSFGDRVNPVGGYTAGCLACAEVFKHLLMTNFDKDELGVSVTPNRDLTFSTLDYSVNEDDPANPELPNVVNVDNLHVIGVGAGGGALLQTLGALESLNGSISLVDSDEVSRSNLNRYIWAYSRDVDGMKADVGKNIIVENHSGLTVESHSVPYMEYSDTNSSELETVVSTVDTARARKQIQWDLPKTILDAAVNLEGDYVVLRVDFGEGQCLACKHHGGDEGVEREMEVLSDHVGLDREVLLRMNTNNEAFTQDQISVIEGHIDPDSDIGVPKEGERFSDWFRQQCGHINLGGADMEVPVPFLPVTAGVLLAGEVIKQQHFTQHRVDNRFTHNLLNTPRELLQRYTNPNPGCDVCQDEDAIKIYESKWDES